MDVTDSDKYPILLRYILNADVEKFIVHTSKHKFSANVTKIEISAGLYYKTYTAVIYGFS